jgi:predicted HicB family RNase H-like nuclease
MPSKVSMPTSSRRKKDSSYPRRKPLGKVTVTFRLFPETHKALVTAAAAQRITASDYLEESLQIRLSQDGYL